MPREIESKELYPGEIAGFHERMAKQALTFRIDNVRVVERKVSSGHKVVYVNRGSFSQ